MNNPDAEDIHDKKIDDFVENVILKPELFVGSSSVALQDKIQATMKLLFDKGIII